MEPIIKVENVSKRYVLRHEAQQSYTTLRDSISKGIKQILKPGQSGSMEDFWALNGVNFDVQQGDRIGVIGRNGAGKSTLLKVLSRITEPTSGRITINGRIASLLEVGTGFHPELTGRENIFLNGSILGMSRPEIKKKFDEIVAFAEVEKFLDTPVKRYSSGMYVRLAFAVAAHLEPEILIVDEVLAVGDSEFQKKCLGKMREVTGEGRTVLFVSHNMAAIQNLCNKVVMLKNGRVEFDGNTEEGLSYYLKSLGSSTIDLANRKDRMGNGFLKFTEISLKDSAGTNVPSLHVGKEGVISLAVHKPGNKTLNNIKISVAFDNEYGHRVLLLGNDLTNQLFQNISRSHFTIDIRINSVSLQPGQYAVTLFAASGEDVYDWVQSAGKIDIEAGDFYGSGKLPPPDQGVFFEKHSFELK